jgi:hypothetical protein
MIKDQELNKLLKSREEQDIVADWSVHDLEKFAQIDESVNEFDIKDKEQTYQFQIESLNHSKGGKSKR